MLTDLKITALGSIKQADLEFNSGLVVFTGETGTGKTMLVTAMQLLIGQRAQLDKITAGSEKATISAGLQLTNRQISLIAKELNNYALEIDEDKLIIVNRIIGERGVSKSSLNANLIPVSGLQKLISPIITIHSQNDQLKILNEKHRKSILDNFGAKKINPVLLEYQNCYNYWRKLISKQANLIANHQSLQSEKAELVIGINKIEALNLKETEIETLAAEIKTLTDLSKLKELSYSTLVQISDPQMMESNNMIDNLSQLVKNLSQIEHPTLNKIADQLNQVQLILLDIVSELNLFYRNLPEDISNLDSLYERQKQITELTKFYGKNITEILEWVITAKQRLNVVEANLISEVELKAEIDKTLANLIKLGKKLTQQRQQVAAHLSKLVNQELKNLTLEKYSFNISVKANSNSLGNTSTVTDENNTVIIPNKLGFDEIDFNFQINSNSKANILPIDKIASGGELSRIMLALEVAVAQSDIADILVFDEVDSGVGGSTAINLGKILARLAKTHQVFVVTHLPQIACFADQHYLIKKDTTDALISQVKELNMSERISELARMLAGFGDSSAARAHAQELITMANDLKAI